MNVDKLIQNIFLGLGIAVLLFFAIHMFLASKNIEKEKAQLIFKSDSITVVAESLIAKGNVQKACSLLSIATNIVKTSVADSNCKAKNILKDINIFKEEQKRHSFLVALSQKDFAALKQNSLSTSFVKNEYVNKILINDMFENVNKREYLIKQKAVLQKEMERVNRIEQKKIELAISEGAALKRKRYEGELRNRFLDMGLDIKVNVTGINNKRMILTFSLFNDVWGRKFDTNGNFEMWHGMGFTRIDLTDGYDYSRYWHWKE
jgi:hypothetical protein